MLEKIENISKNNSYRGRRHSGKNFESYFSKPSPSVQLGKDSMKFSPAATYLSSLKWTVREIEYPSDNSIVFDFFIDEFEFKTKIDLNEFFNQPYQSFNVLKTELQNNRKNKIIARLNIKKLLVKYLINNPEPNINVFREIFSRIKELKIDHSFGTKDSSMINILKDNYEESIFFEFSKILNSIYTFIYKHEKFNVPNKFEFKNNDNELIKIEEITTYYS